MYIWKNYMQVGREPLNPVPKEAHPSNSKHPRVLRRRGEGYTLIELIITMLIAVILITIAVPSFKNMILSSRLTTSANDLVGAVRVARMEAIKRNANTQMCSDSATTNTGDALGAACGTQAGAVYALVNGSPVLVGAPATGIDTPLKLNGALKAVRYGGLGLGQTIGTTTPYTGLVADLCTASMSDNNHRVITMTAGSLLATTTTTGPCP